MAPTAKPPVGPVSNFEGVALRYDLDQRLAERLITALRRKSDFVRAEVADVGCPGLRLRVGSRSASFAYLYRARGHRPDGRRYSQRRLPLGSTDEITVEGARAAASLAKQAVAAGLDPAIVLRPPPPPRRRRGRGAPPRKVLFVSMLLTPAAVVAWAAAARSSAADVSDIIVKDTGTPGLRLRCRPLKATWVLRLLRRVSYPRNPPGGGRQPSGDTTLVLGDAATMSLAKARTEAREVMRAAKALRTPRHGVSRP